MSSILAIDTSTEACSVAVYRDGHVDQRHELVPRQHNQRLPILLRELFPSGNLRSRGIEAIAYGCGPGSFTGLRIAASAVQGLAFSNKLPAIPVSTLACQVITAARLGVLSDAAAVLSLLDARVNEIYWQPFKLQDGLPVMLSEPSVCKPADLVPPAFAEHWQAIGDGCQLLAPDQASLPQGIDVAGPDVLPQAQDMIPLALAALARGEVQQARDVCPVYVRDEITWKKLDQQGKPQ